MNVALLTRSYTPYGVIGTLELPSGKVLRSLERPWLNNKRSESCIPPGTYTCKRVDSPRFGNTFEVTRVPGRSHILFHSLNKISHSEGCIGLALDHGIRNNELWIMNSKAGMTEFFEEFKDVDEFELVITTYQPEYP